MSIVALKKKTATLIKNLSVGEAAFSVNGTRRNQGYIGQNVISRYTSRTLARGIAVRGSGGCCGRYQVKPSIMSGLIDYNDDTVVKKSSLGSKGQIMTQHPWIRRPAPYTSVKPDVNMNNNTQSTYIDYLAKKTIKTASSTYCNQNYGPGFLYTIYSGRPLEGTAAVYFNYISTASLFGGGSYPNTISQISSLASFPELTAYYNANINTYPAVTISIVGYFYVPKGQGGTWTFKIRTGHQTYMWVGDNAVYSQSSNGAIIAYPGNVSGIATYSGLIDLTEDTYYPIRILACTFGAINSNQDIGDVLSISYISPTGTETTDGTGYFFNNGTTTLVEAETEPTTSATLNSCARNFNGSTYFRPYTNNYNRKYAAICTTAKDLTQLGPHGIAMSQSDYLARLRRKCGDNDIFSFSRMTQSVPFACRS